MSSYSKTVRRYIKPYGAYIVLSIVTNIAAALLNLLAFSLIMPILKILFQMEETKPVYIPLESITTSGFAGFMDKIEAIAGNFGYYVSEMIDKWGASQTLVILCAYLVVMTLVKVAITYASLWSLIPVRTGVVRDLRNQLNDKILSLPVSFMSDEHKGDILARISGDVGEVEASIIDSLEMVIKNPILIAIYLAALFIISWQLTFFVIIVLPVAGFIMGRIGKRLKRESLEGKNRWGELMSMVEETLGGLRIIKAFTAEKKMSGRFTKANEEYRRITGNVYKRQQLAHPVSEFLGTVTIAIILWYGGSLILSGESSIAAPTFIYYLVIFYSIVNPAKDLSRAAYSVQRGLASMERIEAILFASNPIRNLDTTLPARFEREICFDNVTFGYRKERTVLKSFNLTIPKGATVALVGASGAGKSTIADLIPRFWDVQQGAITVDGVDIRHFELHELRSIVGYVNQEPILFNDSVYNNIALSPKKVTPKEVEHAAKIANAHDFIMAMPEGYDTNIGDHGNKLSGGEKQRLSIARALLKNSPILILDEATSSLDNQSERLVQDAIEHLLKDRTTLVIAHRLSTVVKADKIAVVEGGKIMELGNHEELLMLDGLYARLYRMQYASGEDWR